VTTASAGVLTGAVLRLEARAAGWRSITRAGLAAGWYLVIFALTAAPGTDTDSTYRALSWLDLGSLNGLFRVSAHLTVFGLLGVLVYLALAGDFTFRRGTAAEAILLTGVLGALDEVHQAFVPGRHARPVDALLDTVGATLALAVVLGIVARARRA
jgi:VanZ family protein